MNRAVIAVVVFVALAVPANARHRPHPTLDLDLGRITTHDSIRKSVDYRSAAIVSTYQPISHLTLLASAGAKQARIGLVNQVPTMVGGALWSAEAHYDWSAVRATISTGQDVGTSLVSGGNPNYVHFLRLDVLVHLVR